MMHFFVKTTENQPLTTFDEAATLRHRLASLDYLTDLYAQKKLGFYFRSPDGTISYELHRADTLLELDARLKGNPQWPYATHEVTPVTKTGDMVRELTSYLQIDANMFFRDALARYQKAGWLAPAHVAQVHAKAAAGGGDYLALMSADEEPIDEAGNYTVVAKQSKGTLASVAPEQLEEMWMRTLRSQVAHLNSSVEFIDYNPVGRSEGLLVGKGDLAALKAHIESTEIFPDTVVSYYPVTTPTRAARATADSLILLRRDLPTLSFMKL